MATPLRLRPGAASSCTADRIVCRVQYRGPRWRMIDRSATAPARQHDTRARAACLGRCDAVWCCRGRSCRGGAICPSDLTPRRAGNPSCHGDHGVVHQHAHLRRNKSRETQTHGGLFWSDLNRGRRPPDPPTERIRATATLIGSESDWWWNTHCCAGPGWQWPARARARTMHGRALPAKRQRLA